MLKLAEIRVFLPSFFSPPNMKMGFHFEGLRIRRAIHTELSALDCMKSEVFGLKPGTYKFSQILGKGFHQIVCFAGSQNFEKIVGQMRLETGMAELVFANFISSKTHLPLNLQTFAPYNKHFRR